MLSGNEQTQLSVVQFGAVFPPEDLPFGAQLERLFAGELVMGVHFQPIVNLSDGKVTGYEALARFPKELGGPPNVCFAKASQLGRNIELEQFVTRQTLDAKRHLPQDCFLTVNVGPTFLVSHQWQEVLSGVSDLGGVVVEITEEASISAYEVVRTCVAQIRALGGCIAVDDAGAGYASLHHILEIKPDFIKLDRHFVENCHVDRAKSTLIEMMGAAANRLDAWVIAEGVETLSELEELIRLGVPLVQGFYTGRPAPEMKAIELATAQLIRNRSGVYASVASLEKQVRTCACCKSSSEAELLLASPTEFNEVVITDEWERPVELVERHPLLGIRHHAGFMRAQMSSAPVEVLQRAVTRPLATRFDPIVVIGARGECLGITAVDQLIAGVI